jgi:hypothetical protein
MIVCAVGLLQGILLSLGGRLEDDLRRLEGLSSRGDAAQGGGRPQGLALKCVNQSRHLISCYATVFICCYATVFGDRCTAMWLGALLAHSTADGPRHL